MSSVTPALAILAGAGYSFGPCISGVAGRALIFAAIDPSGAPCAIKVLDPAQAPEPLRVARFAAEREHHRVASQCVNVLPLHGALPDDDRVLCLRWAQRGSLDQLLALNPVLDESRARQIVDALVDACVALHAIDIVHRDIKPSNILLDRDAVWLADFGLAAHREPDGDWRSLPVPWQERAIGTPGWVAPELAGDTVSIGPANDIYSLACLWRLLLPVVSGSGQRLLAAMLDPEPGGRPRADEVRTALAIG